MAGDKTAVVLVAPGFEEVEAVTVVDVLRRAGVRVVMAACGLAAGETLVRGAHGVALQADGAVATYSGSPDAVVVPGGAGGVKALCGDASALGLLRRVAAGKRGLIAAICAGPAVVAAAGVCQGRRATSYPGYDAAALGAHFALVPAEDVVCDAPSGDVALVTSRGPATAGAFALALVEHMCGGGLRAKVASDMLFCSSDCH